MQELKVSPFLVDVTRCASCGVSGIGQDHGDVLYQMQAISKVERLLDTTSRREGEAQSLGIQYLYSAGQQRCDFPSNRGRPISWGILVV